MDDEQETELQGDQERLGELDGLSGLPELFKLAQGAAERAGDEIGNFRLRTLIAEGGMGVVWEAEQLRPVQRRVALKLIKAGMDTRRVVERFAIERQALASMDHPNIAAVFDADITPSGRPFFAMEYVDGQTISEHLQSVESSLEERIKLFVPACRAVQHAHQKGLIHRDIKPANILVMQGDEGPVPVVIDFGIAKAIADDEEAPDGGSGGVTSLTQAGQRVGTPAYMSPEQADWSSSVDTRSDIYSLGVVLFEMVTGETPHDSRGSSLEVLERVRSEPIRTPRQLSHRLPRDFEAILLKALERDPERRYSSAGAFADDLRRFLAGEPVAAKLPTPAYVLQKWLSGHRIGVLVATVLTLAAVSAIGWMFSTRAVEAERQANAERKSDEFVRMASSMEADGKPGQALGYLASALRTNPQNRVAGGFLMNLLLQKRWTLPIASPIGNASAIAVSGDGTRLAFAERNGKVRIWDLEQASETGAALTPDGTVTELQLDHDGSHVVALADSPSGDHNEVVVWDSERGEVLARHTHEKEVRLVRILVSPNGGHVTFGDARYFGHLLDVGTGKAIRFRDGGLFPMPQATTPFSAAAFDHKGGRVLVSRCNALERLVEIIDLRGNRKPIKLPHKRIVVAVDFSPDSALAATLANDGIIRLWNAETGEPVGEPFSFPGGSINLDGNLAFSPDGKRIAATLIDYGTWVWDLESREHKQVNAIPSSGRPSFSPDGSMVATAASNGLVEIWETGLGSVVNRFRTSAAPRSTQFAQGGAIIVTHDAVGELRIRSVQNLSRFHREVKTEPGVAILDAAFSPDGRLAAVARQDHLVTVWQLADGKLLAPIEHRGPVSSLAFSPDSQRLATGSKLAGKQLIKLWQLGEPGKSSATLLLERKIGGGGGTRGFVKLATGEEPPEPAGAQVQFSPDGTRLVAVGGAQEGYLFSELDGPVAKETLSTAFFEHMVNAARFDPSGRLIVSSGDTGGLNVWDGHSGKKIFFRPDEDQTAVSAFACHPGEPLVIGGFIDPITLGSELRRRSLDDFSDVGSAIPLPSILSACTYAQDGERFATGLTDGSVQIWDSHEFQLAAMTRGHSLPVTDLNYNPTGSLLASSSEDGSARIWDAASGSPVSGSLQHGGAVLRVVFSPHGSKLLTASADGTARMWDVARFDPDRETPASLEQLCRLAEQIGGYTISVKGIPQITPPALRRPYGNWPERCAISTLAREMPDLIESAK